MTPELLEISNLTKKFGGLVVVKNLSLDVKQGEIVGLIGPNGAGKTTVFNLITGFLHCDEGTIKFKGQEIANLPPYKICKLGIARTFQIVKPFHSLSVYDTVVTATLNRSRQIKEAKQKAEKVLDFLKISDWDRPSRDMTIAELKKLEIARAIATDPALILLDEVVAGLNRSEVKETMSLINKIRKELMITLMIIEHVMMAVMNVSDRIVVLHHGEKISEGEPREVANDPEVIRAYLVRE